MGYRNYQLSDVMTNLNNFLPPLTPEKEGKKARPTPVIAAISFKQ